MNQIKQYIDNMRVHRKLMISNFLIIIVPVLIFILIGIVGWGIFRFWNPTMHREWMMLMPSSMADASIQIGFERMNKLLIRPNTSVSDVRNISAVLEAQGIDFLVFDGTKLAYQTPGADADVMIASVPSELKEIIEPLTVDHVVDVSYPVGQENIIHLSQRVDNDGGVRWLRWDNDDLIYINGYPKGIFVIATGSVPFLAKDLRPEDFYKHFIELVFAAFIGLFGLLIIGTGIYLSHRMAIHILKPLKDLQQASERLKNNEPMQEIPIRSRDELGETVETFNDMQIVIKEEQDLRIAYEEHKRQLIAGVCHDIGTPLTSVKGYSEGLLVGIARTEEKREHYAQMIHDSALKIESLVAMLSEFSKLELGQITYRPIMVNINEFLGQYVTQKQDWFTSQGGTLEWSGDDEHFPVVSIDTEQFTRVLDNIVGNSLKYGDEQPAHVVISTAVDDANKEIILAFKDNGIGIEPSEAQHIFDIFYRTNAARTNVANGSGIGLAIVKEIIQASNGRIWAESKGIHQGLTIYIALPIC